jgi:putative Ca2+/H+ antiporter (TMEM165/GDT1 family)
VNLSVLLSTFGLVFLAELGDKTQLAAMALASRYPWKKLFAGIAAAFVLLNAAAVLIGAVLFQLVPLHWIRLASAALFVCFGIATLRSKGEEERPTCGRGVHGPTLTAFLMILLAELGDKTQLATATLAAQHATPISVFAGSTLALWLVSLLGLLIGAQLPRFLPATVVQRAAGLLFLLFGVVFLAQGLRHFL